MQIMIGSSSFKTCLHFAYM